jgi:formate hydrogenlyase subunit 3/multisubunit Na+/H+ antiporter MnhD subunit
MIEPELLSAAADGRGFLLVLAVVLPVSGTLAAVVLGGRNAERVALAVAPVGLAISVLIAADVWSSGEALTYTLGNWKPPLGIMLRADGIAAAMLVVTALVICATVVFARPDFHTPDGVAEARAPLAFWSFLLVVWGSLNAIFIAHDLFNIYVALELLTFGAVPLVALSGSTDTLTAALRYLLFALMGSMFYLLGAALLYGRYGTLDIALLASHAQPDPATSVAAALMTAGLLTKCALFPMHFWLPPAHAGAPAAASAVLSALVVKGSFFVVVRIWFDALPGVFNAAAAQLLATLGAGAIVFGSVMALRQARLKLVIAYSTVAQIGYLFLIFPLILGTQSGADAAWTGGWMQLFSHAFAKASLFMGAGLIAEALGHDRISDLGGITRALPLTMVAFAIASLSLMGIPPTGGFVAKWQLLTAAALEGQWWWALVILAGGLLAGAYMLRVMLRAYAAPGAHAVWAPVSRYREATVLALAVCALLLGMIPLHPLALLDIGRARPWEGMAL